MTTTHNSIQLRHSIALDRNTRLVNSLTQAGINNLKPDLSVVDTILGLKARSAADYGKKIVSNMGTGFNIINTNISVLKDIRARLEINKQDIASLSAGSTVDLRIGQKDYQEKIDQVNITLANLSFIGVKLVDGSLATAGLVAAVGSEAMPNNYGPYRVQTGFTYDVATSITFPKLLPGDGTAVDAAVSGRFEPLFPTISAAFKAETDGVTAINTALNPATVVTFGGANGTTQTLAAIVGGTQVKTLAIAIDAAVVNERPVANNSPNVGNTKGQIDTVADAAAAAVEAARASLPISLTITAADITQARDNIKAVYNAAGTDSGTVRIAARDINVDALIPANANSVLVSVYQSIATTVKATGFAMYDNAGKAQGAQVTNDINIINSSISAIAKTTGDITTSAGNIETSNGRNFVNQKLSNAIAILDKVIASATGQMNNLKAARSNMEAQIVELDDAANNYLLANYKEIISKIAESARSLKVISLVDVMYEKTLNGQINSLEATAASVAA